MEIRKVACIKGDIEVSKGTRNGTNMGKMERAGDRTRRRGNEALIDGASE